MGASAGALGGTARRRRTSPTVQLSKLNVTEIHENMISREVAPGFEFIARHYYDDLLPTMPQPSFMAAWSTVNFEFVPGIVALPSLGDLQAAIKITEVREIRGRGAVKRTALPGQGYSNLKLGVFALQDLHPGVLVAEYLGQVQVPGLLPRRGGVEARVLQSHVLFIPRLKPSICVDARRHGNAARHIRRSCRPNCEVKMVLTGNHAAGDVHLGVFARNSILEGEELLLPIDYEDGNTLFKYECACANAELCLAPREAVPVPKPRQASAPTFEMVDTLRPYQRAKTPLQPSATVVAAGSAAAGNMAKLSREERKLLQYIEQIEKMDHAEKKSANRKSSSGMISSSSGANVGSRSPSNRNSPSRTGSPMTPIEEGQPRPSSGGDRRLEDDEDDDEEEEAEEAGDASEPEAEPDVEAGTELAPPAAAAEKTRRPSGRPPKSPRKRPGAKVKRAPKPKASSSEDSSEDNQEGAPIQVRSSPSRAKLPGLFQDDELVDVMADMPVRSVASSPALSDLGAAAGARAPPDRYQSVSPGSSYATTEPTSGPAEGSTSQLETPSKKRVSLSDYMRKRRATGDAGREDGEIAPPAPPAVPAAYPYDPRRQPHEPVVFSRPEPLAADKGYYEMPPHLTPPPPLATHAIALAAAPLADGVSLQTSRPPELGGHSGRYNPQAPRKESYGKETHGYQGQRPVYSEPPAPAAGKYYDAPAEPVGGSGAVRYGYQPKPAHPPAAAARPYHEPPAPAHQAPGPQQPVYRPRPSLLKAAQDLPTRWEEAQGSSRPAKYPAAVPDPYPPPRRPSDYLGHGHSQPHHGGHGGRRDYAPAASGPYDPPAPSSGFLYEDTYAPDEPYGRGPHHKPQPPYCQHQQPGGPGWKRSGSKQSHGSPGGQDGAAASQGSGAYQRRR